VARDVRFSRQKCAKFDFHWGSTQTLLVELTAIPDPLAVCSKFKGGEREQRKKGWEGE